MPNKTFTFKTDILPYSDGEYNLGNQSNKWKVNGQTIAEAASKSVDTSIADESSSVNLPTSAAVAAFVEGKNYIPASEKGIADGVAELDENGKVPASQLPAYVDDVREFASRDNFPLSGSSGIIYVAEDTNLTYRWSGSEYVVISPSLALGTTASTAHRGDHGNTAYLHATDNNKLTIAKTEGLYKVSVTGEGHVGSVSAVTKEDIEELGIPGESVDVQINGVSITNNGVANVPLASNSTIGAVKVNAALGIGMATGTYENVLNIQAANHGTIKSGAGYYAPIVVQYQHESTFYGLAKAAGADMASSSNPVGTYTDEAKAKIKNMLGVTQTLTVTVITQDDVTVTGQTVTVRANDADGEVFATALYSGQPVSFSIPSGFQYHVSVSDTLDHHFNPTSARGVITNVDVSVTLQYSDFSSIRTAADIKAALDVDLDLTDLVGEQITCSRGTDTLTWDVADYDETNKVITLLLHDAFGTANMVFEPAQALMWCENGLAAGDYTFKWNSTQCYFTLTEPIPSGGQLRATNSVFSTYESQSAAATIETGTVSTTEIAGATDLGATGSGLLNHHDRVNYGSNNYAESALYWWLNSSDPANTLRTPVTKFSRAYSYNVAGFMNGLDSDFINCLDDTIWLCSTNNVYECPQSLGGYTKGKSQTYTVTAKFGLASEMEIFGTYGGTQDGSQIFDLYSDATNTDRIKYRGTSAQTWWVRSPNWSYAHIERGVSSSGNANYIYAYNSYSVVPACKISKSSN